jgi:CubicO group peptidase (beta-lactamase class C family)
MSGAAATCLILAQCLLPPALTAQGPEPPSAADEVRSYVARLGTLGFSGVLVATRDGQPAVVATAGLADREAGHPWTPATVSTIGSITKQFTGAAVLRLAEEGLLAIADPIEKHFDGVPADKLGITLHQLLTHSSGIVDLEGVGDFDPVERDEYVRRILAQELAFAPGQGYEYSNAGYSLLGAVIEKLTGSSYESWLRRSLLAPHGLYETGYLLPEWGAGRLAQGYRDGELWGTVLGRPMAADGPYWALRANGGIHSTAWDMVRWAQALLDGRVLTPESMERYWAPHVAEQGADSFYGYGWVVADLGGTRVITHNGGNGVFFADMAIVPAAGLVIVLMTNVVADFPPAGEVMVEVGRRLLAGETLPPVPELVTVERAELEPYGGLYELGPEAGGGRLEVALGELENGGWELTVEPRDPVAFGHLLSTRPWDARRAGRLSARIDALMTAYLAGDMEPLAAAYDFQVSAEYLAERWDEQRRELEASRGALTGHRVLGTAMRDGRDVTLVRFEFANGWFDRAYVWDPEAEARLQGTSRRGLDHRLHVLPGPRGSFATWDPRTGESRAARLEAVEGGGYRLSVGEEPPVTATMAPAR